MRISDWSSDVCSSDLTTRRRDLHGAAVVGIERALAVDAVGRHRDHAGAVAGRVIGGIRTAVAGGDDDGRTACVRARDRIGFGLAAGTGTAEAQVDRSEEHTSELQSLMRISYAVFCLKKKKISTNQTTTKQ